jgi:hypothetical protein
VADPPSRAQTRAQTGNKELAHADPSRDLPRALERLSPRRINLQVVADPQVNNLGLRRGQPRNTGEGTEATGKARISVSIPRTIQGSGRIACRHRAIPDLPELEVPFSTITCVVTGSQYRRDSAGPDGTPSRRSAPTAAVHLVITQLRIPWLVPADRGP